MQLWNKQRQIKRAFSIKVFNHLKYLEIHLGIEPYQKKQGAEIRDNSVGKLTFWVMENTTKVNSVAIGNSDEEPICDTEIILEAKDWARIIAW